MTFSPEDLTLALTDFPDLDHALYQQLAPTIVAGWNQMVAHHKACYQDAWASYTGLIDATGTISGMDLDAAVTILDGKGSATTGGLPDWISRQIPVDLGNFADVPDNKKIYALDGRYQLGDEEMHRASLMRHLRPLLRPETQAVIELGAGCGRNLGRLLAQTGRRDITYISCEQSPSGLAVFRGLLAAQEDVAHRAVPFDFNEPDLECLTGFDHILVFTCAAIEQIPFLRQSLITDILAVAPQVDLAFFEPVGWQRFGNIATFVADGFCRELSGQVPQSQFHKAGFTYRLQDDCFIDNAASWALAGRYNMNLVPLVQKALNAKVASMTSLAWDSFGSNPFNPMSFLSLSKI
ncbi:hypothetical protein [Aestuariispira insulae]|uniref:Methyltransferase family protein n=1 Tax=Aestuariispira insulae TaxID=1461337 RepID=A0A3D9HE04_9PROT|nr:hypothetical protein [Aestuariispira insulae]RED47700.1 hypothetical protein DFP90_10964 [Aestuariispira insulae]